MKLLGHRYKVSLFLSFPLLRYILGAELVLPINIDT